VQQRRGTDALNAYRRIVTWVADRLAAITAGQLAAPTPCSEWNVAAVLQHLHSTTVYYTVLAEHAEVDTSKLTPRQTDGDHAQLYRIAAARALRAWSRPGALNQSCAHAIAGSVPGFYALSIHAADSVVHGWDVAVATGQDGTMDPMSAEFALDTFQVVLAHEKARGKLFDPARSPEAADMQSALLAFTGRASVRST
jgi:uncharacterized protein (TIGR03086 family)